MNDRNVFTQIKYRYIMKQSNGKIKHMLFGKLFCIFIVFAIFSIGINSMKYFLFFFMKRL